MIRLFLQPTPKFARGGLFQSPLLAPMVSNRLAPSGEIAFSWWVGGASWLWDSCKSVKFWGKGDHSATFNRKLNIEIGVGKELDRLEWLGFYMEGLICRSGPARYFCNRMKKVSEKWAVFLGSAGPKFGRSAVVSARCLLNPLQPSDPMDPLYDAVYTPGIHLTDAMGCSLALASFVGSRFADVPHLGLHRARRAHRLRLCACIGVGYR